MALLFDWNAGLASLAAGAAVLAGVLIARHRMFMAQPGDHPGLMLKAFNRAMIMKWVVTLLLFVVTVRVFPSEPAALAVGFCVTILSAIPVGMVLAPKPEHVTKSDG